MEKEFNFDTISEYNAFNNHETLHPLVSVVDFSKAKERTGSKMNFELYCIFLKDVKCGDLKYGRHNYDYQAGTLVFISPGQTIDVENKVDYYQPAGHGLVFHPDLIRGTSLSKSLSEYNFFSYHTNEALHLSSKERQLVLDLSGVQVPPLLFISFVENAIKHNNDSAKLSYVNLFFEVRHSELLFKCINSKPAVKAVNKSGGLGLSNIKRRLELLFPSTHDLTIEDNSETYCVTLTLKL